MEIFRFLNTTSGDPLLMNNGVIINNLKSKTWIERYGEAGEFTLTADLTSNIRSLLPLGSYISHLDSTDIMIVENHEVKDYKDRDPEVVITGRGFETILENRIVGALINSPYVTAAGPMYFPISGNLEDQIYAVIMSHIHGDSVLNPDDELPHIEVGRYDLNITTSNKNVELGDLYTAVVNLLKLGDLGLRVYRPRTSGIGGLGANDIYMAIHQGTDQRNRIMFSYDTGEIETIDSLWSNKLEKNAALVYGRWIKVDIFGSEVKGDRRYMLIDASDIDNQQTEAPSGDWIGIFGYVMGLRGWDILKNQKTVGITKAEIAKDFNQFMYRRDFNIGDIVSIYGSTNETTAMRIIEYVEIEDETGMQSYPTLAEI
jgi:Siphovirus ReqiPepy6 Gp37-like protein